MFGLNLATIEDKLKEELKNEKKRMLKANISDLKQAIEGKPAEQALQEVRKLIEKWERLHDS